MTEIAGVSVRIISADGDDDEELALLTRQLRSALLELDVQDVEPQTQQAPGDSKAGFAVVLGWLWVNIGGEALKAVIDRVAECAVNFNREIDVTVNGQALHLKRATREQQDQAFQEWLARVKAPDSSASEAARQEGYL
jgi:hypothetical protein